METDLMVVLEHFFTSDLKIKQEMYNIAPQTANGYIDESSLVTYTNKVDEGLKYIFSEIKCITKDIFGINSSVFQKVMELEKSIMINFYNCGLNMSKLRTFYERNISNMDPEFLNMVKKELKGYYLSFDTKTVPMISSINEMLHYIHSYIVNNDDLLQNVPLSCEKNNDFGYPISLRGSSSKVFENLFRQFPNNLEVGYTDMVIINENKLIMMVRDLGHALTIEITLNGEVARLEYFIPKLCNIDMINALPGVNKVNENSIGATGVIETNIDLLPAVLFDFMSKVPTDRDMGHSIK
jgi:hypothetical protein